MATKTLTHGYYRFTDVFFEWGRVLPCIEDIRQFKAFIAYDCIVNPDHPLSNGKGGLELWLGTLPNGETRLMFTLAQIEYIRYWLDAMKLTTQPIPLPSSDYLVGDGDLVHVSPVIYKDGPTLKKAIKNIDKSNKKLRGTSTLLTTKRLNFEKARVFWAAQKGAWLAIDFEAWDRDHSLLLEYGYSLLQWKDGERVEKTGHLIIKEHRSYHQTYVDEYRDFYNFGKSEEVNRQTFKSRIQQMITELSVDQPLFLIFHDYRQDVKYMNSPAIEAPLAALTPVLPETTPDSGLYILDTSELFGALVGEGGNHRSSLKTVCKRLEIPTKFLHNAGNDAHYTMLAAIEMMSGDPVDMQRDKRWPNSTENSGPGGRGVRVQFPPDRPWDEDSGYSDTEGLLGGVGYDPKTGILREKDYEEGEMQL